VEVGLGLSSHVAIGLSFSFGFWFHFMQAVSLGVLAKGVYLCVRLCDRERETHRHRQRSA
jgi:hypothetical protein